MPSDLHTITFRVEPHQKAWLKELAWVRRQSYSDTIRELLSEGIKAQHARGVLFTKRPLIGVDRVELCTVDLPRRK